MDIWQDEHTGEWWVHGPDDENHAGPLDTKADAEEAARKIDKDGEDRDRLIEKKIKERADEIAPGMSDKITFIRV